MYLYWWVDLHFRCSRTTWFPLSIAILVIKQSNHLYDRVRIFSGSILNLFWMFWNCELIRSYERSELCITVWKYGILCPLEAFCDGIVYEWMHALIRVWNINIFHNTSRLPPTFVRGLFLQTAKPVLPITGPSVYQTNPGKFSDGVSLTRHSVLDSGPLDHLWQVVRRHAQYKGDLPIVRNWRCYGLPSLFPIWLKGTKTAAPAVFQAQQAFL